MRKILNKTTMSLLGGGLCVYLMGCTSGLQPSSWLPETVEVRPAKQTAESYYKIGEFFQERKEYALAVESFREALQVDAALFEAYNSLGICYDLMNQHQKAIAAFQDAIHLRPDRDEVHNNLGYSQLVNGDIDAAIKSFAAAISLSKVKKARYYNNLGLAYTRKGQHQQAYQAFVEGGGEEKARRNIAALSPVIRAGEEFLMNSSLDAESRYQSSEEVVPVYNDFVNVLQRSVLQLHGFAYQDQMLRFDKIGTANPEIRVAGKHQTPNGFQLIAGMEAVTSYQSNGHKEVVAETQLSALQVSGFSVCEKVLKL